MIEKSIRIFLCLFSLTLSAQESPIDLSLYEASLYSQNGEDGILAALFRKIGTSSRYCIEIGASDGITNSNTYLLRLQGWRSLLLDRSHENEALKVHKEFVTKENINRLLEKYEVPSEIDLLSINIHYNSFYIWKEIDAIYRPAIVVISFNRHLSSDVDRVVPYHPYFCGDGSNYFGASLSAFCLLGQKKGYTLVYIEKERKNLFFIRDDLLKGIKFKDLNQLQNETVSDFGELPFCTFEEAIKR